jgi:hypothetical protein
MKTALAVVALLVSTNTFAYYENPHQEFDMTNNMTNKTTITFRQVNNVTAECDKESRKRGNTGFGYNVDACSFWNGNRVLGSDECVIITAKTANFHTIGHEVRHCLQGNFHK